MNYISIQTIKAVLFCGLSYVLYKSLDSKYSIAGMLLCIGVAMMYIIEVVQEWTLIQEQKPHKPKRKKEQVFWKRFFLIESIAQSLFAVVCFLLYKNNMPLPTVVIEAVVVLLVIIGAFLV